MAVNRMATNRHGDLKLFSGNSCVELASSIADKLKMNLGRLEAGTFSDGEVNIHIEETVRGCDVFVVQSVCYTAADRSVNDNLMELLVIIDALKRASAGRITAVIPYFGYARQDRKSKARDPITAKLVANLITSAGASRVLTMDLHAPQLQGFFDIPVDHLLGIPVIAKYLGKYLNSGEELVVVSPDMGSVTRARSMATKINASLAIVDKRRPKANAVEIMNIIGEVKDKTCLLVDDMIDTAGTITQSAQALVEKGGAKRVLACCTHGVLSGPAVQRLKDSVIEKLQILNTIPIPESKRIDKLTEISVAPIFAEAIESIYGDLPVSKLYN